MAAELGVSPAVILVYNVSHEDVVLHHRLGPDVDERFDRPAFSSFQSVAKSIGAYLDTQRILARMDADTDVAGRTIAAGFRLGEGATDLVTHGTPSPLASTSWARPHGVSVRIGALHHAGRAARGSEGDSSSTEKSTLVSAVYFPLVVTALALWLERCAHYNCHKIIYLVSGAGSPSDPSESSDGNSTRAAARLIARFVRFVYEEELEVCTVDSGAGVFQHGANARFVNTQLRPRIMAHCERIAANPSVEDWKQHVHVCVVLTSGAPARVSALTNGLRHFEPDFIHVWRLKTFIYTHKVSRATNTLTASLSLRLSNYLLSPLHTPFDSPCTHARTLPAAVRTYARLT